MRPILVLLRFTTLAALAITMTANAGCGPDNLGISRTLTLKRESGAYGTAQHAALPLQKGEVVLTFDDGPDPTNTPLVLKALADQCTLATFFLVGDALLESPELARREVSAGHSNGIHSNTHPHLGTLSPAEQLADLKLSTTAYQVAFGTLPPAYRFPFLEETPAMLAALDQKKITVMSIDLAISDWQPDDTTEILRTRLLDNLKTTGGGIILMHDLHPQTAAALPELLKALKEHGYQVVHVKWEAK